MSDAVPPTRPRPMTPLRFVGRVLLSIVLLLWTLLSFLLRPLLRPLYHGLGRLGLFSTIGNALGRLPPYAALVALAVPFIIIEPFKAFALYWFGVGHLVQGGVLFVASHLASLLIVDRVYHAARGPLLQIVWFKRLMTWLVELRSLATDWAKSTAVWQASVRLATEAKVTIRGWFRALT